jgi:DNA-binding CsgD family transcriptional regulator/PAS domain-containing protein
MVSPETLSELLAVLYSAPLQQQQWQSFLALLCRHTDARFAVLICADTRLGLSIRSKAGSPEVERSIIVYNEQYGRSDPFRTAIIRTPRTGVVQADELLPNEGLLRTDMYRDVLVPLGARYGTILFLTVGLRRMEAISLWRNFDDGPMDEDGNRLLNLVFPHIQKALEIRQVLGVAQQRIAGGEAMVDASATPTFLLTWQGRVLHSNPAAESLLREADGLFLQDKFLAATERGSREPLRNLLMNTRLPVPDASGTLTPAVLALDRSPNRRPLQLLASPLTQAHRTKSRADLVLLVTDPDKPVNFPDDALRTLFGFTPAQVDVAVGLLMGYSLEEIASLRGVSVGTVRNQLKAMLSKTGTSRQSDLIRLLMTLPQAASTN